MNKIPGGDRKKKISSKAYTGFCEEANYIILVQRTDTLFKTIYSEK